MKLETPSFDQRIRTRKPRRNKSISITSISRSIKTLVENIIPRIKVRMYIVSICSSASIPFNPRTVSRSRRFYRGFLENHPGNGDLDKHTSRSGKRAIGKATCNERREDVSLVSVGSVFENSEPVLKIRPHLPHEGTNMRRRGS